MNRIKQFFKNLLARFFFIPFNTFRIKRLQRKFSKMSRAERRRYERELVKKVMTTSFKPGISRKIRKRLARSFAKSFITLLKRG